MKYLPIILLVAAACGGKAAPASTTATTTTPGATEEKQVTLPEGVGVIVEKILPTVADLLVMPPPSTTLQKK